MCTLLLPPGVNPFAFKYIFFFVALRPNSGHDLILEVSRSHTTTHQSVGLLWTGDQLIAETST